MQVFNGGTQTVQSQYAYDGANRLSSLTDYVGPGTSNPLHGYSYTYDAAGNRSSITEDGTTSSYTYDGENQLLTVTSGGTQTAAYTYDTNHNRTKLVTPNGTTTYTYDSSATDTLLQQKTDPNGKVTQYAYDANGNLTTATYDPTGANQVTTYHYDASNRLTEIDEPSGTVVAFAYDANGQRVQKTVQTGGSNPTMSQVNDVYQAGRLAYQTNLGGTVLATFTYDPSGIPESVVVGADPVNGPRYYYVYNGHGDVVALTDASGNVVASYSYDVWGNLTASSENIPNANGWTNPYRYDGRDGARYDAETGLYWLSTRAYDPTLGRFLQRDPLGRAPLYFWDQPYAYAGNNPLVNVDPTGERYTDALVGQETAKQQIQQARRTQQVARTMPRMTPRHPAPPAVHPQTKTNSPKPKVVSLPAPLEKACGPINGICDWIASKLSSISPHDLGDWLRRIGVGLIAIGIVVLIIDAIFTLKTVANKGQAIETAIDLVGLAAQFIGTLSAWPGMSQSLVYFINSIVQGLLSGLHFVLGIFNQLGWFGQAAVSAGIEAATNAADAEVAPVEDAAGAIIGTGISYLLGGVASAFLSAGDGLIAWGYAEQGN